MISQKKLILEYFRDHPDRPIGHPEVVDWATAEYTRLTGEVFRDPDRAIRSLHQEGLLIKEDKGVYRFNPDGKKQVLPGFTLEQKAQIFKRDGYRCVVCGLGEKDGVELHADHIRPRDKGGESTVENGQTLCAPHNFRKKNLGQTETGKKMFINLKGLAQTKGDSELANFCRAVLEVYDEYGMNSHIRWKDKS